MTRKVFFFFVMLIIPMAVPAKSPAASRIVLKGDPDMYELAERLGKKFMKTHTDANILVRTYGTSEGFKALMSGQADIWMTRRDPKKIEKRALKTVKLEKITVGHLPIAIIVNSRNSIERLTIHQMRKIFTGEI